MEKNMYVYIGAGIVIAAILVGGYMLAAKKRTSLENNTMSNQKLEDEKVIALLLGKWAATEGQYIAGSEVEFSIQDGKKVFTADWIDNGKFDRHVADAPWEYENGELVMNGVGWNSVWFSPDGKNLALTNRGTKLGGEPAEERYIKK